MGFWFICCLIGQQHHHAFTYGLVIHQHPFLNKISSADLITSSTKLNLSSSLDQPISKRTRFLNIMGFKHLKESKRKTHKSMTVKDTPAKEEKTEISTLDDLDHYFTDPNELFRKKKSEKGQIDSDDDNIDYKALLTSLSVKGDTQIIGSKDHPDVTHPVLELLHSRRKAESKPSKSTRSDGFKIALAIEGGGMRGCVSAGMVAAIDYLGLRESFDVVYGSSAGTIIGSYFLTKQLPWFGPEIYYDSLTTAGRKFIDSRRLMRAIGFGLIDPRLIKDVITRPNAGKPVLNLDFLLKESVMERKPLQWDKFVKLQETQPLKVITSGLKSEKSLILDMEKGHFGSFEQYTDCMHASCLLPGIAGPAMNMCLNSDSSSTKYEFITKNNMDLSTAEPMADALIYEPLPYRSAIKEGATHVVVLRTRPDGVDVTGKPSIFEGFIMKRFFMKKNKLPNIYKRMKKQLHKKLYAEDVINLNNAANDVDRKYDDVSTPHLMPIALPPNSEEVTRLETRREQIFEGVRRGFARAYDALVEDPNERGRGAIVAKEYFPDEILDYDPLLVHSFDESAFSVYLQQNNE